MRRIIEETLVSLDGVIEDPADWVGDYFDDAFLTRRSRNQKGRFVGRVG
jgi:hypothetical protein